MLIGIVVFALLVVTALVARRRTLQCSGGTVECSINLPGHRGWAYGVGRYDGDTLRWYRLFSLATRPQQELSRRRLSVVDRRRPYRGEAAVLSTAAVVVVCLQDDEVVELALSESALTGFLAWLEASPPGAHTPWL